MSEVCFDTGSCRENGHIYMDEADIGGGRGTCQSTD